jgi:hypothetical protein
MGKNEQGMKRWVQYFIDNDSSVFTCFEVGLYLLKVMDRQMSVAIFSYVGSCVLLFDLFMNVRRTLFFYRHIFETLFYKKHC